MGKGAVLEIERRCNQMCVFCSVDKDKMKEITFEEIKEQISSFVKEGVDHLTLTGGEPTLNKEISEILKYCKENGIKTITLQTNGIMLSNKTFMERICSAFPGIEFLVSFHSYSPETYAKITGVNTHYKLALEAFKNISESGESKLGVGIVINSLNYKRLKEDVQLLHEEYPKISFFNFIFLDPICEAKKNSWAAVRMYLMEKYLHDALEYIKSNRIDASVDRLPLCYLRGFEEYSANTKQILRNSEVAYSLLYKDNVENASYRHVFTKTCDSCKLKKICGGLPSTYIEMFGSGELYPVFDDLDKIVKRLKGNG